MRELSMIIRVKEVPLLSLSGLDLQLSFRATNHVLPRLTLHFVNYWLLLYLGYCILVWP